MAHTTGVDGKTRPRKRKAVKAQLKDEPEKSDRRIAQALGVSHATVATIRHDMEDGGEVVNLTTSKGADGKTYPRKRKQAEAKRPEVVVNDSFTSPDTLGRRQSRKDRPAEAVGCLTPCPCQV